LFEVPKPLSTLGIGVDNISEEIRSSNVLTGNDLGMLGNIEKLPSQSEINEFIDSNEELSDLINSKDRIKVHRKAREYLTKEEVLSAWKVLLA
jgi:hypothetical protein